MKWVELDIIFNFISNTCFKVVSIRFKNMVSIPRREETFIVSEKAEQWAF